MEITERFPTDSKAREAIAVRASTAAARAFAQLCEGMPDDHVVVANWVKPRFGHERSHVIGNADALSYVIEGVLDGDCQSLRFFTEKTSRTSQNNMSYDELFLS